MKQRDILLLLGSSVFLIIAWVAFSIFHQLASSTINQAINSSISPITPTFDISVINALKTRVKVAPEFSGFFATQAATPTDTPIPTPLPIATPLPQTASTSALPTGISLFAPTPTATQGGTTK